MRSVVFAIPGDLATPTGGYAYARRLLGLLPEHGITATPLMLPDAFPAPTAPDLTATAAALAALPPRVALLVDGLAYGAMPEAVIAAAGRRPIVALVHHPLGFEAGLAPDRAEALIASETAALALATRVLVTSPYTGRLLAERLAVASDRIDVAPPGTEPADRVPPRRCGRVALLSVGAVTPRKAHDVLVRALAGLKELAWHLTIAGALDRAPEHVARLEALIAGTGFADRVTITGPVAADRLDRLYRDSDAVVSASLFEGYGMALAEGLARGLPIVMARGGAADETVPDAAALKVEPGDVPALADALRVLVSDPGRRETLADAAWAEGRHLPRWRETTAAVAASLRAAAEGADS